MELNITRTVEKVEQWYKVQYGHNDVVIEVEHPEGTAVTVVIVGVKEDVGGYIHPSTKRCVRIGNQWYMLKKENHHWAIHNIINDANLLGILEQVHGD